MSTDLSSVMVTLPADILVTLWKGKAAELEEDRDVLAAILYGREEDLKQIAKYLGMDAEEHIDDIELGDVPPKVYDTLDALRKQLRYAGAELGDLRKNALTTAEATMALAGCGIDGPFIPDEITTPTLLEKLRRIAGRAGR